MEFCCGLVYARVGEGGGDFWALWVVRRRAIWSLRLRLHSGLRQSGARFARVDLMARLKPCPFEGSVRKG
jgi:hypothetical protein